MSNKRYYEFEARLIAHIKASPDKAEEVLANLVRNCPNADVVRMIGAAFDIHELPVSIADQHHDQIARR